MNQVPEAESPEDTTEVEKWNKLKETFRADMTLLRNSLRGISDQDPAQIWKILSSPQWYGFIQDACHHLEKLQRDASFMAFDRNGALKDEAQRASEYKQFRSFFEGLVMVMDAFAGLKNYPPAVRGNVLNIHTALRSHLWSLKPYLNKKDQDLFGGHFY